MNALKLILVFALIFLCAGCGDGKFFHPHFSVKSEVVDKTTDSQDISKYVVSWTPEGSKYKFRGMFWAPYSFATLNDCIAYDQGVIKVVPCGEEAP